MAERYLIDTNAVIKYLNETFPQPALAFMDLILDEESIISFITKIELLVWKPANPDDLSIYEDFIRNSNVLMIDDDIIQETINIRKLTYIKIPDALIAATALVNDLTLHKTNHYICIIIWQNFC